MSSGCSVRSISVCVNLNRVFYPLFFFWILNDNYWLYFGIQLHLVIHLVGYDNGSEAETEQKTSRQRRTDCGHCLFWFLSTSSAYFNEHSNGLTKSGQWLTLISSNPITVIVVLCVNSVWTTQKTCKIASNFFNWTKLEKKKY